MLTHRNLVVNTWQCRHWMSTLREGQEVFLGVLPFFHDSLLLFRHYDVRMAEGDARFRCIGKAESFYLIYNGGNSFETIPLHQIVDNERHAFLGHLFIDIGKIVGKR